MAEHKGYSRVMIDFVKMILGGYNKTFLADEWGGDDRERSE